MNAVANVVRAELYKLVHKKRAYVLAGLYWILYPALVLIVGNVIRVNLAGSFIDGNVPVGTLLHELASPFGLARVALVGPGYMSPSFYMIIIALLAALLIGEERSQNMWKTTLVAQPNRLAVLTGKFLVAWLAFAVLVVGGVVFAFLFGALGTTFLGTGFTGDWTGLLTGMVTQVLFAAAGIAFAFLLIFLLRNVALGIVSVFFLPALLEALYMAYATLVGFQPVTAFNAVFQFLRLQTTLEDLPRYFFTSNLYAPSRGLVGNVLGDLGLPEDTGFLVSTLPLGHSALVMTGYFVIFGLLLAWRFRRHDVA